MRGGERVFILPGIMGSKLGYPGALLFDDVIWADPVDIAAGRLTELRLKRARSSIQALGVMLFAYLKLKLKLKIAGYDPEFFPYDWRQDIAGLGKSLAGQITADGSKKVHLVAHSMGGLVARALLLQKPKNLGRIITLGTPNYGSFSPIQAFRGSHSVVNKVAFLDIHHSSTDLADIFGGFPGLLEMIPAVEKYPIDFFDLDSWPKKGVHPGKAMLADAQKVQQQLPIDYDDLYQIIGIDRETVVDARVEGDEFVYTTSLAGDGTVPLECALLSKAKRTYYVNESHGSLANNSDVARAVDAILAAGETKILPDRYEPRRATLRTFSDRALEQPAYQGNPGRALSAAETRHLLAEVAAPDVGAAAPAIPGVAVARPLAPADADMAETVVIGRRHAHSLNITLAHGSITDIEADAYVLGMFRSVPPGGPAALLSDLLGGAIDQMVARRMFNANVGEVTIVPTGKHLVRADMVVFAGLGAFDTFSPDTFEIIGENLVRTFISTRIDDFATVPIGGASGAFTPIALRKLMTGFLRALQDTDADHRFRGITICEADRGRYDALCAEFYKLCGTKLFDGFEVTLREVELTPRMQVAVRAAEAAAATQDVFLLVREEPNPDATMVDYVSSVLTSGAKATVYKARQSIKKAELDRQLKKIDADSGLTLQSVEAFGAELANLMLPENVQKALARHLDSPLVIVHDAAASRIPWETLKLSERIPALEAGLTHRYEAENLSIAKWLEERQRKPVLDVLLVINPTKDLAGAAAEGKRVKELLEKLKPAVSIHELEGDKARRHQIANCLGSGQFDVLHYAGHAFFDSANPSRSGILCAGKEVLSGADLSNLASLPSLAFFNACEAGRVRRGSVETRIDPKTSTDQRVRRGTSFAEAFLRGGIANYLGTYWPVGDSAAVTFAETLYQQLLAGQRLGAAVKAGRHAVRDAESPDWADYILYGDPNFILKQRPNR
ncbi:MAG: alpha/beta fold hydrolase [Rhodoplanes sp.]